MGVVAVKSELVAAQNFELDLMSDGSVRITLRCKTKYESAILFDELKESLAKGYLNLAFAVEKK